MRTASGIVDERGHYIAGVVLLTAGYSADGKYSQQIAGADGGTASGTYTATDKAITLSGAGGESVEAGYSLNGDALTVTTPGSSGDSSAASTCELKRS